MYPHFSQNHRPSLTSVCAPISTVTFKNTANRLFLLTCSTDLSNNTRFDISVCYVSDVYLFSVFFFCLFFFPLTWWWSTDLNLLCLCLRWWAAAHTEINALVLQTWTSAAESHPDPVSVSQTPPAPHPLSLSDWIPPWYTQGGNPSLMWL